jgi:hypothetical protein
LHEGKAGADSRACLLHGSRRLLNPPPAARRIAPLAVRAHHCAFSWELP